ncbi:MAG: hypothetical protein PHH60_01730 [Candidatus Margulisbacteria bacterium]|nr:hypothetical protein [Candidatus Margulisiibacteriota bacterium]
MDAEKNINKSNYDVVSLSQPGKAKRANYVQDATFISKDSISVSGKFIRVFADIFLKKEAGSKSYF